MNRNALYYTWAGLFVLCAGLGFVAEPAGALRVALTLLSVLFFVPPFLLLDRFGETRDRILIRNLSLLSLGLTVLLIVISIVTAAGSERLGRFLHVLLSIVSTPMMCSGSWALSLFLWSCLLMLCLQKGRE